VRVGRGRAERVAEVGGVEPGGPVALCGLFSWVDGWEVEEVREVRTYMFGAP